MKKKYQISLSLIIFFVFVAPPLLYLIGNKIFSEVRIIRIEPQMSSRAIATLLQEEKIIRSKNFFLLLLKLTRKERKLQAGLYELRSWTNPFDLIRKLAKGEVATITLTIPEGYTATQIANLLEEKQLCSSEKFLKVVKENDLEGYLFPARYTIPSSISIEGIISMMEQKFKEVMFPYERGLEEISLKDIVIIASIVEKEAQMDWERPIVASVLYNRIKKGLPLASCATVEYALGEHKARLTTEDLLIESPYNTYLHYGLPPGPICNPGEASLKAALFPAKTNFLFFVSKGDGTNAFSETYTQHLKSKGILLDKGNSREKQP